MLPRRPKLQIRPALFHQRQADPGRGQVSEVAAAIQGEVLRRLLPEFSSLRGLSQ